MPAAGSDTPAGRVPLTDPIRSTHKQKKKKRREREIVEKKREQHCQACTAVLRAVPVLCGGYRWGVPVGPPRSCRRGPPASPCAAVALGRRRRHLGVARPVGAPPTLLLPCQCPLGTLGADALDRENVGQVKWVVGRRPPAAAPRRATAAGRPPNRRATATAVAKPIRAEARGQVTQRARGAACGADQRPVVVQPVPTTATRVSQCHTVHAAGGAVDANTADQTAGTTAVGAIANAGSGCKARKIIHPHAPRRWVAHVVGDGRGVGAVGSGGGGRGGGKEGAPVGARRGQISCRRGIERH